MPVLGLLAFAQKPGGQRGCERDRQHQGGQKRDHHRQRQGAEEYTRDPLQKGQRNENHDRGQRRSDQGPEELPDSRLDSFQARQAGHDLGVDRLDHHDRVINH